MTEILIYTDGACSGNPGPGGWGALLIYGEQQKAMRGGEPATTNNRMEMMAAIKGLEALTRPCEIKLFSDSAYLVNAFNQGWLKNWQRNGWKTAKKEPVINQDLWQRLSELSEIHQITWIKVKGHSDNEFNNRCDQMAVEAAAQFK